MPTVYLCEINHEAYNLGRLLSVLATLQKKAHKRNESEKGLEGPGVVERYYGAASTAPATVFGVANDGKQFKIMVHQGNVLNTIIEHAEEQGSGQSGKQSSDDKTRIKELKKLVKELEKKLKSTPG